MQEAYRFPSLNGCLFDNCTNPDSLLARVDSIVITGNSCTRTFTVYFTILDQCGNESADEFVCVVNIHDDVAPIITCPGDLTIDCEISTLPDSLGLPTATDDCQADLILTSSDSIVPGACPQAMIIFRTWTANDGCDNTSSCLQIITVQDTTAPIITCLPDVTVECRGDVPPPNPGILVVSDNCANIIAVTHVVDLVFNQTCLNRYDITRIYQATDECGNSATCSQSIVVFDDIAPVLNCPPDLTVNCDDDTSTESTGIATATDNCEGIPEVTWNDMTVAGQCPQAYTINREWLAADECGNSSTCIQVITVQDTVPPVIDCPGDITLECTDDTSTETTGTATASDNCSMVITFDFNEEIIPGLCPQSYTIVRTWVATDECGNSSTCIQNISVQDTVPPDFNPQCQLIFDFFTSADTVECPAVATISLEEGQLVGENENWTVAGVTIPSLNGCLFDNCTDPDSLVARVDSIVITGDSCIRTFTVYFTILDQCGNESINEFVCVVNIHDDVAPVITCPANLTIECDQSTLPDNTGFATATDDCNPVPDVSYTDQIFLSQNCPQEYFISRLWTASDGCGNSSSCFQSIQVVDTTPPIIVCPADVTVQCAVDVPIEDIEAVTATDNCSLEISLDFDGDSIANMTCDNRFVVYRRYIAIDECGNSSTCTQTITVFDDIPPTITCPGDITVACATDLPEPNIEDVTVSDNCSESEFPEVSFVGDSVINMVCENQFMVLRTWLAIDVCGNSATCTQTITVFDSIPPSLTCPPNLTFECASLVPAPDTTAITTNDNCDGAAPIVTFGGDMTVNQTCANRFTLNRTYISTDVCGNSATCVQVITVFDDIPPSITCPAAVTVQCASLVPAVNTGSVTTSDNCTGPAPVVTFVSDVTISQTCVNQFILNRTYMSTDNCGNTATCIQVITVFDNTPPSITCPAAVTVQCASQVPAVNTGSVITSDNCTGPAPVVTFVSDVTVNQTCVNRFTLNRTYRSTDACGNSATCTQVITVFDNTPPSITCPAPVTVQCATDVPAVNTGSVTAIDNCTGPAPVITFVSDVTVNQTCINRFTLNRTYRATDACGNSATCVQVITVFDNTPPVIAFNNPLLMGIPNNGTLEVQCFGQDPNWDLPSFGPNDVTATDNCSGTVTLTYQNNLVAEGNCPVDGYINRYKLQWTATDVCGNSAVATIFLNLIDTIPPVIQNVPEDITVNCDEVPDAPTLTATDECLCACVVELDQDGPHPGCQDGQIITRTWKATDYCGNVAIEQQHITLVDKTGPILTIEQPEIYGLPNGTLLEYTCNEGGIPAFFNDLSAESVSSPYVCGGLPTITFETNRIISRNCKRFGYIEERTFTWTGVDACGNTTTLTITAHLIDDEPPVIIGVPDEACVDDPILQDIEAIDNCGKAGLIFWDTPIPSPCGNGTAFRRTYEAVDPCGNYARDTVILIDDNQPPVIKFINPDLIGLGHGEYISAECDAYDGYYTPWGPDDVAVQDNCPDVHLDFEQRIMQDYQGCENGSLLWLRLTWTATDLCGNSSSLYLNVYLIDETPPVFDPFPSEVTIGCNDEWPTLTATDNCAQVQITTRDSIIKSNCEYEYDVIRQVTATDLCGNSAQATQIIHVGDHSGPVISGVDTLLCNDLSIPDVTAWDPCAEQFVPVTMTQDTLDVSCPGLVIERTWTATDACGNVAEVKQRIILNDTDPPVIEVPSWSIIRKYMDNNGNFVRLSEKDIINQLNALDESSVYVHDLCDIWIIPVFTVDITYSDNCVEDGYYEHRVYTWVATDECGNSTVLTFAIDVLDDIPPAFTDIPDDITVICGQLPPAPQVHATDYADPVTITYEQTIGNGDAPGHYIVLRTWTAKDPCGNTTVRTQRILWIPDTFVDCNIILPEQVDCNTHGVVIGSNVSGGIGPFTYVWDVVGQECFIQSGQGTPEITIYVGFFDVNISLTVTDAFGCQSVCTANLECFDPLGQFAGNDPNADQHQVLIPNAPNNTIQGSSTDYLQQVTYWPNPANTNFNVSFTAAEARDVDITFMNFLGEVVLTDHMKAHAGANTRKIDVTKLPEGTYLFQVMTDREVHAKGIVIMR